MSVRVGGKNETRFKRKVRPKDFKNTAKRVLAFFKDEKKLVFIIGLLVVIQSLIGIGIPYYIGKIIDIIEESLANSIFIKVIAVLATFYLINFLVDVISSILTAKMSQRVVKKIRSNLFIKLQKLPISFYNKNSRGDTMSRFTNDVDNISSGISSAVVSLISDILNIVLTFVMMLLLSVELTFLSLLLIPLVLFLSRFITKRTRVLFKEQQVELGKLNAQVEEIISDINIVKGFNYEEKSINDFKEINDRLFTASLKAQIYTGLLMPLMNVISNFGFAIVCIAGGILASKNYITVGVIASFLSYTKQFTRPLNEIANLYNTFQSAMAGCERVFEIFDEEDEKNNGKVHLEEGCNSNIEFKDVSFSYDKKNKILDNINLYIKKGSSNAIIGETGSGKTTIINLITNLYNIDGGVIILDNNNLQEFDKESLRDFIGVVPQEVYLFNDTIMENIRYGNLEASEEDIISASKVANAHKFISKLKNGYNTSLSEQGEGLSEGQKQLISIARTILKNPHILILDEATSSIDTSTERKIQETIKVIMEDRTSIIIAHRLSTIYHCDNIIVLKDGKIAESGNHKELMEQKGIYYNNILLTKGG